MFAKPFVWRTLVGLCLAIPTGILATAVAQAGTPTLQLADSECQDCHQAIQSHWANSGHGQAFSDPLFQEAWTKQGKPLDCLACHTTGYDPATGTWQDEGVSCSMCHYPASINHPDMVIMPTDISSRHCGECHLETYTDWQSSGHGQEDLACIRCHNPHTSNLKRSSAQELCQSCHADESHFYDETTHAQSGMLCTDCHLHVAAGVMGEGHARREHTFAVSITTCVDCHGDHMHVPADPATPPLELQQAGMVQSGLSERNPNVAEQMPAQPVSPVSVGLLGALIGMGAGIVLAPWLKQWYLNERD